MAMEIIGNYNSYAAQSMAGSSMANSTKKKESEKTQQRPETEATKAGSSSRRTTDYANELSKLVPSVGFRVGNSYASDKEGKTLTVNPKLLEKMQNDPELEKEMKELIKGVESMTKLSERLNQATGWKTVFRHSYIDENGNYRHIALIRNEFMLNMSDELREERKKNSEKLLEKQKENAAKKKEELEEKAEEKLLEEKTADESQKTDYGKAEQLLSEKINESEDGIVHMNDAEFREIVAAIEEESAGRADAKEQVQPGASVDLRI